MACKEVFDPMVQSTVARRWSLLIIGVLLLVGGLIWGATSKQVISKQVSYNMGGVQPPYGPPQSYQGPPQYPPQQYLPQQPQPYQGPPQYPQQQPPYGPPPYPQS